MLLLTHFQSPVISRFFCDSAKIRGNAEKSTNLHRSIEAVVMRGLAEPTVFFGTLFKYAGSKLFPTRVLPRARKHGEKPPLQHRLRMVPLCFACNRLAVFFYNILASCVRDVNQFSQRTNSFTLLIQP